MLKLDVKVSLDGAIKALGKLEKQTRAATMIALTKTAKHAQKATYEEFKAKFDRPTRSVMRSLYIQPAKKDNLLARVFVKDTAFGNKSGLSMAEMIGHHFEGGSRRTKKLEEVLRRWNFLQAGEFVVPGEAARLDANGNISRGQLNQILSQLRVGAMGYDNAPTKSARSRRNVAKTGRIFWSQGLEGKKKPLVDKATGIEYGWVGGRANHLPKGAWAAIGGTVRPLLLVVKSTSYRRRFDMQKIGQAAVDRHFSAEFNAALKRVKETER